MAYYYDPNQGYYFNPSDGEGNVHNYNDAQRAGDGSSNAVNRGTTGVSPESGERVSLRGSSGGGSSRPSGSGRSSSGGSGSGARTSSGSGRSDRSGSADRGSSSGKRSGTSGNRSGVSGGGNGSRPRRRKKVTWQRKVKRFFRRLIRTLSRLPQEMLILLAAAVVIAVILIVLIVRALLPSGGSKDTASSSAAVTESDATEETDADGSTDGTEDTDASSEDESAEVTTAGLLQGLDNYTITTDETKISELQSSLTATIPSSYTASSVLTTSSGVSYAADNLFDSDLTTSWQEGEDDEGAGVTITSTFASGTNLSAIVIWSGNETTEDKFNNNNRPAQITISVSCDSQSYSASYTLEDYMGAQAIIFVESVPVESVVIRIDSVYEGEVYNDTVISELSFLAE